MAGRVKCRTTLSRAVLHPFSWFASLPNMRAKNKAKISVHSLHDGFFRFRVGSLFNAVADMPIGPIGRSGIRPIGFRARPLRVNQTAEKSNSLHPQTTTLSSKEYSHFYCSIMFHCNSSITSIGLAELVFRRIT